jgi:2-desacetyl-2-hydroxyethyl bacteriochlorophyllide A dehydrogenase
MRRVVCLEPEQLVMTDVPEPRREQGEALVRIRRIGICGTDIHAYHGRQPFFTYPRVLGHELAGVVEAIDDGDESGLQVGDQVAIIPYLHCGRCSACRAGKTNCCAQMRVMGVHVDGGMADWVCVPTTQLVSTPGLTLEQSALLEALAIGAHAVRRSGIRQGETVLVVGAGPIGLGVMAFAKRRGARVIAMDLNQSRLQVCRDWAHVDELIVAHDRPDERLAVWTGGEFPSTVFDATGSNASMAVSVERVAHGGTVVFVGLVQGDVCIRDAEFHKRELTLLGSRNATREDFATVQKAVTTGAVDVAGYVTHRIGLDDAAKDFAELAQPSSQVIKAMIEV